MELLKKRFYFFGMNSKVYRITLYRMLCYILHKINKYIPTFQRSIDLNHYFCAQKGSLCIYKYKYKLYDAKRGVAVRRPVITKQSELKQGNAPLVPLTQKRFEVRFKAFKIIYK